MDGEPGVLDAFLVCFQGRERRRVFRECGELSADHGCHPFSMPIRNVQSAASASEVLAGTSGRQLPVSSDMARRNPWSAWTAGRMLSGAIDSDICERYRAPPRRKVDH